MHEEGGWPKDVNLSEPELMIRHRKKLEKEENYQLCMPLMYEVIWQPCFIIVEQFQQEL